MATVTPPPAKAVTIKVYVSSNLTGAKRAVLVNGKYLWVSPAMRDLLAHATTAAELGKLLVAFNPVRMTIPVQ